MKTTTTILLASAIGSTLGFAPASPSQRTSTSLAFFGGQKKAASTKGSPLADEALETYLSKYPADAKTASFSLKHGECPNHIRHQRRKQASSAERIKRSRQHLILLLPSMEMKKL
eukprot:scaffold12444_cov134-Skeletonema_marinoi.AAC.3